MLNVYEYDSINHCNYVKLLSLIAQFSKLFSENNAPYINYRVVENVFCKCFPAKNLARSDTAFDAQLNSYGIGIKTFLMNKSSSFEKIAEFNSCSHEINKLSIDKDVVDKVSTLRNERISLAKRLYGIEKSQYHIIARAESKLIIFDTDYDEIDLKSLKVVKKSDKTLTFRDKKNYYRYNFSKSTLYRKFILPSKYYEKHINLLNDPLEIMLNCINRDFKMNEETINLKPYVILPLYSTRLKPKQVAKKSSLNQWNAGGRKRKPGEVYIPIPTKVRKNFVDFFPKRDVSFDLVIPTGEVLSAKVCQEECKALMTNPNNAISDWLLRDILKLNEKELLTMSKLNEVGIDSVVVTKESEGVYSIDVMKTDTYEKFKERLK